MYLCICNAITETMVRENPSLKEKIGTKCGICKNASNKSEK